MAKGKGKASSGGPRKTHGPKRKLFHKYDSTTRLAFGKAGLLNKYNDYESFCIACTARGKRNTSRDDFNKFNKLSKEEQDNYFKQLKVAK